MTSAINAFAAITAKGTHEVIYGMSPETTFVKTESAWNQCIVRKTALALPASTYHTSRATIATRTFPPNGAAIAHRFAQLLRTNLRFGRHNCLDLCFPVDARSRSYRNKK